MLQPRIGFKTVKTGCLLYFQSIFCVFDKAPSMDQFNQTFFFNDGAGDFTNGGGPS